MPGHRRSLYIARSLDSSVAESARPGAQNFLEEVSPSPPRLGSPGEPGNPHAVQDVPALRRLPREAGLDTRPR
jgi:hypothetical protein